MSIIPVILSFNHPEITSKAINTVIAQIDLQKTTPKTPIILVHNGSEHKHIERLKLLYPNIDHLVLTKNIGFSGGANFGIKHAFEKYNHLYSWVLFLTNDCELESWPSLEQNQSSALLAPWIWTRKTDRIDSIGGKINLKSGVPSHLKSEEEFKNYIKTPLKNTYPYVPGSAFLIHQTVFYKLKGFNEAFGTYWEDIDFSLRALKSGLIIGDLSTFKVRHKIGKTCHKQSYYTTYLFQRNRHWVCRHYIRGIHSRLLLEIHLLSSWVRLSLKFILSKRYMDFFKLIKAILEPSPLSRISLTRTNYEIKKLR